MADPRPTIVPTTARAVGLAFGLGAAASWLVLQAVRYAGAPLPLPGTGAWASVLLLALATTWLAWRTRDAVRRGLPIDPAVATTRLRIGKAGILVAAVLGGGYLVLAWVSSGGLPAPMAQDRVMQGGLSFIACIVWGGAALALERSCRIPRHDDPRDDRGGKNPSGSPD